MQLYRFRPCANEKQLKDRIDEIINGGLYLASSKELNDPMDGMPKLFFESKDRQLWTNLIEYIFWLVYSLHNKITSNSATLLPCILNEKQKKEYEGKKNIFINNDIVQNLITNWHTSKKLTHNQLENTISHYLIATICALFESIQSWEDNNKIIYKTFGLDKDSENEFYNKIEKNIDNNIKNLPKENTNNILDPEILKEVTLKLIKHQSSTRIWDWKKQSLPLLRYMLEQIDNLCYFKTYCACFSATFTNSSLWGIYAEGHKGLCITYKTDKDNKIYYDFNQPTFITNNNKDAKEVKPVKYLDPKELTKVNFWFNMGAAPAPYEEFFYKNSSKKTKQWEEEKSKEYWKKQNNLQYEKTKDWGWENEYRLSLNTFDYIAEPKIKQKIYINPNKHIKEVIFGYRMPYKQINKVILAIRTAKTQKSLLNIKLYQAYFNDNNEIEKKDITSLI